MSKPIKLGNSSPLNFDLSALPALGSEIAEALRTISRLSEIGGFEVYLVGGIVREMLAGLGEITTSPDISVIGEATSFADALTSSCSDCELISTSQHHTAKVRIGNVNVDVASARIDLYDPLGSLPKISLVEDIELDLARRDFSINAMAIPLRTDGFASIIDPFNGLQDAKDGILRTIRPDSFREDPLRIMRGIRLAARYTYRFDDATEEQISTAIIDLGHMTKRSPQRVFNEFRLWFTRHENLDALVKLASEFGILSTLGVGPPSSLTFFARIPAHETDLTRFAAFAYQLSPQSSQHLTERLQMPTDWIEIASDAAGAQNIAKRCLEENLSDFELYSALIAVQPIVVRSIAHIESDNRIGARFQDFQTRLFQIKPELNGDCLLDLGVPQGPKIGQLLDELLALRIEGRISNADEERRHVLNRLDDG